MSNEQLATSRIIRLEDTCAHSQIVHFTDSQMRMSDLTYKFAHRIDRVYNQEDSLVHIGE
jgi:hypothetical protein